MNKLLIKLNSSLLIGGYSSSGFRLDKVTARDRYGCPIIPASAIKGALRIEFEKLAGGSGKTVCHSPSPEEMKCNGCLSCSLFGNPLIEGKIRIYDGVILNKHVGTLFNTTTGGYDTKTGVSISRQRKVSVEGRLFYSEIIKNFSEIEFEAPVFYDKPFTEEEKELWDASIRSLIAIGGSKNQGLGFCNVELITGVPEKYSQIEFAEYNSIKVRLEASSPLLIGRDRGQEFFSITQDYIPGSTLRGALARKLSDLGKFDETFFETLFFDNCYRGEGWNITKIVPLTAKTCKHYPGLLSGGKGHGVVDNLLYDFILKKAYEQGFPLYLKRKCPRDGCSGPLRKYTGYMNWNDGNPESFSVKKRIMTKSAVDRSLNTSYEGMLYALETIETDEIFTGRIRNAGTETREMLKECHNRELLIGGAKGRGFGRVLMQIKPENISESVEENIQKFNEQLKKLAEEFKILYPDFDTGEIMNKTYFSLTLQSDTILYSDTMSPQLIITEKYLKNSGMPESISLINCYKTIVNTGGWNYIPGLPKEKFQAIGKGSVFLYSFDGEKLDDKTYNLLLKIEQEGLGELREEGFGRMKICDKFHYVKEVF